MDIVVARAGVARAKAFFDDVTVLGNKENGRSLWEDTKKVLGALVEAGFVLGLKKCQFLVPEVVVLGYQLLPGGY